MIFTLSVISAHFPRMSFFWACTPSLPEGGEVVRVLGQLPVDVRARGLVLTLRADLASDPRHLGGEE